MSCGALAYGSDRMLGHARWLTFVRRSPPWVLQVRKLSIYIQWRYILRCGNFLQRPFAYHGKPPREAQKSAANIAPRPSYFSPRAPACADTPWLRLRRRSRLTDQQMQEIAEVERRLAAFERVGGRQTVLRTLTNMTTTPIAEVSDLQDPNAGDPSPAGLADGLRSRGELRGSVAPCSRWAASRVAGRSSGSPQRSAPSSISAALSAAIELRRLFPGINDMAEVRELAQTI